MFPPKPMFRNNQAVRLKGQTEYGPHNTGMVLYQTKSGRWVVVWDDGSEHLVKEDKLEKDPRPSSSSTY